MRRRLIMIGIGGATCSGKTLLSKHLLRVLPNSILVHQDDFAPPADQIPISPEWGVPDWDAAETAIEWDRFRETLQHIKATGRLHGFEGHDHLNKQIKIGIDSTTEEKWREEFLRLGEELARADEEILWVVVDGFIMFWDERVDSMLDVRIFLRVPAQVLKQRREIRQTYVLQTGDVWTDPPEYWPKIVYPAYIRAHAQLFEKGDVESGKAVKQGVVILEGEEGMSYSFDLTCRAILESVKAGKGCVL